jgi:hypothetical protein
VAPVRWRDALSADEGRIEHSGSLDVAIVKLDLPLLLINLLLKDDSHQNGTPPYLIRRRRASNCNKEFSGAVPVTKRHRLALLLMRFVLLIVCFSLIFGGYSLTSENFAGAGIQLRSARLGIQSAKYLLFFYLNSDIYLEIKNVF